MKTVGYRHLIMLYLGHYFLYISGICGKLLSVDRETQMAIFLKADCKENTVVTERRTYRKHEDTIRCNFTLR